MLKRDTNLRKIGVEEANSHGRSAKAEGVESPSAWLDFDEDMLVTDIVDPSTGERFVLDVEFVNALRDRLVRPRFRSWSDAARAKKGATIMNDDDRKLPGGQNAAGVPACAGPSQLQETKFVVRMFEALAQRLSELEKLEGARERTTSGIPVEAKFRVDEMPDGTTIVDLSETSIFCSTIGEDVALPNVSGGQWREKSKK